MQNKNDEEGPEMSFENWDEAETDTLKNEIESGLLWGMCLSDFIVLYYRKFCPMIQNIRNYTQLQYFIFFL